VSLSRWPASLIGPRFIERAVIPTWNCDGIIKFSPSVQNVEPVGPGLQQSFHETTRGFSYRQFNSTLNGIVIPGAISSFFSRAPCFMAHDIGSVQVAHSSPMRAAACSSWWQLHCRMELRGGASDQPGLNSTQTSKCSSRPSISTGAGG